MGNAFFVFAHFPVLGKKPQGIRTVRIDSNRQGMIFDERKSDPNSLQLSDVIGCDADIC